MICPGFSMRLESSGCEPYRAVFPPRS
jgi:hypothetical protein